MRALVDTVREGRPRLRVVPLGYVDDEEAVDVPPKLVNALQLARLQVEQAEAAIVAHLVESGQRTL